MAKTLNFSPNVLPFDTTLSRHILRQHLAHINQVFWIGQYSNSAMLGGYLAASATDPNVKTRFSNTSKWTAGISVQEKLI